MVEQLSFKELVASSSLAGRTREFAMKIAKYKCETFGCVPDGTIVFCFIIAEDGDKALVYHPANAYYLDEDGEISMDRGCGCVTLCKKTKDNILVSLSQDSYINLTFDNKFLQSLRKLDTKITKRSFKKMIDQELSKS